MTPSHVAAEAEPVQALGPAARVDLALRSAWASSAAAPGVLAVRVGELGVELLLDGPRPDAPDGFEAVDGGLAWRLDPTVSSDDMRTAAGEQPPPMPGLITVGTTDEGPVLIDVHRARVLSVEGDAGRVASFLAGVELELSRAPWAAGVQLRRAGSHPRETGAGLGPIVVVATAMDDVVAEMARAVAASSNDIALVAAGPVPGAEWRLVISRSGESVLQPLGLDLRSDVDAAAVAALGGGEVSAPLDEDEGNEGARVLVLGPVDVRWPNGPTGYRPQRRKLAEVVAYLATHRNRPVPAERLRTAAWPLSDNERSGEVADSTFRATMSRTRTALGTDGAGTALLPESRDGSYELSPAVTCDWDDFRRLVGRADGVADEEAAELLRRALFLVRGAPFADSPRGSFGWAWSEQLVSAIEVTVAGAAARLGALALDAGQHAAARWAAERGLLVLPTQEGLHRLRMSAAVAAGDFDGLEQAYTEACRAARAIDGEPQHETTVLYEQMRRTARREPSEPSPVAASV